MNEYKHQKKPGVKNSLCFLAKATAKMADLLRYGTVGKPTAAFCASGNRADAIGA